MSCWLLPWSESTHLQRRARVLETLTANPPGLCLRRKEPAAWIFCWRKCTPCGLPVWPGLTRSCIKLSQTMWTTMNPEMVWRSLEGAPFFIFFGTLIADSPLMGWVLESNSSSWESDLIVIIIRIHLGSAGSKRTILSVLAGCSKMFQGSKVYLFGFHVYVLWAEGWKYRRWSK